MNLCPITTHSRQRHAETLAFCAYTYAAFDELVVSLATSLMHISAPVLAFTPAPTPLHIAFFFAAWRLGKTVYPLSFRLPPQAVAERLARTGATWLDPHTLPLPSAVAPHASTLSGGTLLETSGTSGLPKLAHHRIESHLLSAQNSLRALSLQPQDRYCLNLPLFHVSGLAIVLRTFLAGATLLLPDRLQEATHLSLVPTQLYRLLKTTHPFPSAKSILVGGAPLPPRLEEEALARGLPLVQSYGMTETSAMAFCSGRALPHIEYTLSPEGELLLKGATLLENYWNEPKRKPGEWFATKDLAYIDETGRLHITGRKDRQFISGGENIQPEEIEEQLLRLPGVITARVKPVVDVEFGRVPHAYVQVERPLTLQEITQRLKERLPSFKVPKTVTIELFSGTEK